MCPGRLMSRCLALFLVVLPWGAARADDWPHWMGPTGDNVWREDGVLERFPKGGPTILWRTPIAGGYAGPAVKAGRVFVADFVRDPNAKETGAKGRPGTERVHCLDAKSGRQLWTFKYPVTYSISYPAGPRCTPTVDGERVYTLGAHGRLICFNVATGKVCWSKELTEEYATKPATWGYTNHPLIDGDKLLCVVGGRGSHAVAFDKTTGKELWRALTAKEQGYCPPVIYKVGGVRQLVLLRADGVSGLDPETGKEYWTVPYDATHGSIIMRPVLYENFLYMGGFSHRNLLVRLSRDKPAAEVVWRNLTKKALSAVNVQPFLEGNVLYGFDQGGAMYAVELPSGERLWQSTGPLDGGRPKQVGTAFIVKEKTKKRNRFWFFNEQGELVIGNLSREGYQEYDRAKVIEPTHVASGRDVVWSMPAFANRHVYVRNDKECVCVDLSDVE